MFELDCGIVELPWGKEGYQSQVAILAESGRHRCKIVPNNTYAELWMGSTDRLVPSRLKGFGILLSEYFERNPKCLGPAREIVGRKLPFIFKFISVNQSDGLKVYPDKETAILLNKYRAVCYKDTTPKSELVVAVSQFELLVGFRPLREIKRNILNIPELKALLNPKYAIELLRSNEETYELPLKRCINDVLACPPALLIEELNHLACRVGKMGDLCTRRAVSAQAILPLSATNLGDPGCFLLYFLNYVALDPGESVYIPPKVLFTYLKGDAIICTSNSENVVRVALTDLPKDFNAFNVCTKIQSISKFCLFIQPEKLDDCMNVFAPPIPDFAISRIRIPSSRGSYTIRKWHSASILGVISGSGKVNTRTSISKGKIFFVPADTEVYITFDRGVGDDQFLEMYQAFCNVDNAAIIDCVIDMDLNAEVTKN